MNAPFQAVSSFTGGQVQDVDPHLTRPDTYRLSENGSTRGLGADLQTQGGAAGGWSGEPGTLPLISTSQGAPANGVLCGFIQTTAPAGIAFYRRGGVEDEIGRWSGTAYSAIWNSSFDVDLAPLGLSPTNPVDGFYLEESPVQKRIYFFAPGTGEPCVLDLGNGTPEFLSGHSLRLQPDCRHPRIAFSRRLEKTPAYGPGQSGSTPLTDRPTYYAGTAEPALSTGVYRLGVRYRLPNGHTGPLSPLSEPVFLTDRPIDDTTLLNPFRRTMGVSGVAAREGIEWKVTGLDTRWPQVELVYVYYTTPQASQARVFSRVNTPSGGTLLAQLVSNVGTPLEVGTLLRQDKTILSAQTMRAVKNRLFFGGVETVPPPTLELSAFAATPRALGLQVEITPPSQNLFLSTAVTPTNPRGIDPASRPARQELVTSSYLLRDYNKTGSPAYVERSVDITNDYSSFRGQQAFASFRGYFGRERVGLGLVAHDLKGHGGAVQPLGEVVLPDRASATTPLSHPTLAGKFAVDTLGLRVEGIRIRRDSLYDSTGRLRYGGLSVVRRPSAPGKRGRALHQGVVLPVVQTDGGAGDDWRKPPSIFPSPSLSNAYATAYANAASDTAGAHQAPNDGTSVMLAQNLSGTLGNPLTVPGWGTYHSPDALLTGGLKEQSGDRVRAVTVVRTDDVATPLSSGVSEARWFKIERLYLSDVATATFVAGRPRPRETSRVTLARVFPAEREKPLKEFDPEKLDRKAYPNVDTYYPDPLMPGVLRVSFALTEKGAALLRIPDFETVDVSSHSGARGAYVVNYERADPTDDSTESASLEAMDWISTGHFLPLTQALIDILPTYTDGVGVVWVVLGGVDVFGGDCFTMLADMTHLAPGWDGSQKDYGQGMVVPLECSHNHELRLGRRLAESGLYPENASRGNASLAHLTGGVSDRQPEDWNLNQVLDFAEDVLVYHSLPEGTPIVSRQPATFYYSNPKTYGQREDAYRRVLPLNYRDLDAASGPITASASVFDGLYFTQSSAFGQLPVAEQGLVPSTTGARATGTGADVGEVRYVSRQYGCQHPRALVASDRALYFLDARQGALLRHSQAGLDNLSFLHGLETGLRSDCAALAPTDPVSLGLETGLRRIYATVGTRTHLYDEARDQFEGNLTIAPRWWASLGGLLLAPDPATGKILHRMGGGPRQIFFGVGYPARLRFAVAAAGTTTFDNARLVGDHAALGALPLGAHVLYSTDEQPLSAKTLIPWIGGPHNSLSGGQWRYELLTEDDVKARTPARLTGRLLWAELYLPAPATSAGGVALQLTAHLVEGRPSLRS